MFVVGRTPTRLYSFSLLSPRAAISRSLMGFQDDFGRSSQRRSHPHEWCSWRSDIPLHRRSWRRQRLMPTTRAHRQGWVLRPTRGEGELITYPAATTRSPKPSGGDTDWDAEAAHPEADGATGAISYTHQRRAGRWRNRFGALGAPLPSLWGGCVLEPARDQGHAALPCAML